MRTARFLLFILLSFTVTWAWADIMPLPWGKRPQRPQERAWEGKNLPGHPPEQKGPGSPPAKGPQAKAAANQVSMAAANVRVRIHKMAAAPGAGKDQAGLLAQVTGEFDMVCAAAPQEGGNLDVLLPIAYEDERPAVPVKFALTIDGKPVAEVKTDTWPATDENHKPRSQWGYAWTLTGLKGGQKRRITVQYSLVLPQKAGKAQFTYFLRSGARWEGPIGQEVVNVTADQGLRVEVLSPTALQPEKRSDTSLTWRITNAKPAEDIRLTIVAGAKP
jgi:hypothetical protein